MHPVVLLFKKKIPSVRRLYSNYSKMLKIEKSHFRR